MPGATQTGLGGGGSGVVSSGLSDGRGTDGRRAHAQVGEEAHGEGGEGGDGGRGGDGVALDVLDAEQVGLVGVADGGRRRCGGRRRGRPSRPRWTS